VDAGARRLSRAPLPRSAPLWWGGSDAPFFSTAIRTVSLHRLQTASRGSPVRILWAVIAAQSAPTVRVLCSRSSATGVGPGAPGQCEQERRVRTAIVPGEG
jgi:hypothetical protein